MKPTQVRHLNLSLLNLSKVSDLRSPPRGVTATDPLPAKAPPKPMRTIRPDYPRSARQRGEQGNVVLEIEIGVDGVCVAARVAVSCGFAELDAAAVKAAREITPLEGFCQVFGERNVLFAPGFRFENGNRPNAVSVPALKAMDPLEAARKADLVVKFHRIIERESTRPIAPSAALVQRTLDFIKANVTDTITAETVARNLHVSRRLIDMRLKENGEETLCTIITRTRLSLLADALGKSDLPTTKLIAQSGFRNCNHARLLFKRHFGMTMREWRNRWKTRNDV